MLPTVPADNGRRQAAQFLQLQKMLPAIYEGKQQPIPKLVGPDSHGITDDLTRAFVAAANAACAVAEAELTEAPVRTPACAHREWITRSF